MKTSVLFSIKSCLRAIHSVVVAVLLVASAANTHAQYDFGAQTDLTINQKFDNNVILLSKVLNNEILFGYSTSNYWNPQSIRYERDITGVTTEFYLDNYIPGQGGTFSTSNSNVYWDTYTVDYAHMVRFSNAADRDAWDTYVRGANAGQVSHFLGSGGMPWIVMGLYQVSDQGTVNYTSGTNSSGYNNLFNDPARDQNYYNVKVVLNVSANVDFQGLDLAANRIFTTGFNDLFNSEALSHLETLLGGSSASLSGSEADTVYASMQQYVNQQMYTAVDFDFQLTPNYYSNPGEGNPLLWDNGTFTMDVTFWFPDSATDTIVGTMDYLLSSSGQGGAEFFLMARGMANYSGVLGMQSLTTSYGAIPEPGSYAAMLGALGLCGIGWQRYRRKRRKE